MESSFDPLALFGKVADTVNTVMRNDAEAALARERIKADREVALAQTRAGIVARGPGVGSFDVTGLLIPVGLGLVGIMVLKKVLK